MRMPQNPQTWLLETVSAPFCRNNTVQRPLSQLPSSSLLCCFPHREAPQTEEYFTSRAKREVPDLPSAFLSAWRTSFSAGPLPCTRHQEKKVLWSSALFFCLCFFTSVSICPLFFSPVPSLHPPHTSNMSFFVFCTYGPFSLLNSPPSPLLWRSLSLSGAQL